MKDLDIPSKIGELTFPPIVLPEDVTVLISELPQEIKLEIDRDLLPKRIVVEWKPR